jgi:cation transporter-like permease
MPLNEIMKLLVPAVCATLLSGLMVRRVFGALAHNSPALQTWTFCAAGACMGSFAGLVWVGTLPLLDHFPIDYVLSTAVAVVFALALAKTSFHKKAHPDDDRPEQ